MKFWCRSLAIPDFNMPDLTGVEVFEKMHEDPRLSKVPVIIFSAHSGSY